MNMNFPEKMISTVVMAYIYQLMCLDNGTDEDLESYCDYESSDNPQRKVLIREVGKSCIVFKGMCTIAKRELPRVEDVAFDLSYDDKKLYPKVRLRYVPSVTTQAQASNGSGTVTIDTDDDLDVDDEP